MAQTATPSVSTELSTGILGSKGQDQPLTCLTRGAAPALPALALIWGHTDPPVVTVPGAHRWKTQKIKISAPTPLQI